MGIGAGLLVAAAITTQVEWDVEEPVMPDRTGEAMPSALGERAAMIDDEAECVAEGGSWRWINASFKACVLPYPDAGEECSASSECAGGCFASDFDSLEAGLGMCRADTDRSGCLGEIGGSTIECLHDDIMTRCTIDSLERECLRLR